MILFADDTTIHDSDTSFDRLLARFRLKFEELHAWICHNRLEVNWSKTKFMLINHHSSIPSSINLLGNDIEVVSEFKLLGVYIDNKLTFATHVNMLKKAYSLLYNYQIAFPIMIKCYPYHGTPAFHVSS